MKWPLKASQNSNVGVPFFNQHYLFARSPGTPDSTIVWTSEIPWQPLQDFIQAYKTQHSRFISTSHVLTQAIGQSLARHPELNRRVVGRRLYDYKDCNVCLTTRVPRCDEVFVVQIHQVENRPLYQIAQIMLMKQMEFARADSPERRDLARYRKWPMWLQRTVIRLGDWLDRNFVIPVSGRIDRLRESGVLVNDFSSTRFPLMRSYKPSRQPGENKPLSVTLGPPEEKVVLVDGKSGVKQVAPLTVRVDHRICDSFQLAQFLSTVIEKMSQPAEMDLEIVSQPADGDTISPNTGRNLAA